MRTRRSMAAAFTSGLAAALVLGAGPVAANAAGAPPALTGLRVVGTQPVDVSTAPVTLAVSVRYTGGDSGLSGAAITADCTSGCGPGTAELTTSGQQTTQTIAGTAASGVLTFPLAVPRTAAAGSWSITDVTLGGLDSSQADFTGAALTAYVGTDAFTVTKTADAAGPVVGAITLPDGGSVNTTTSDSDLVVAVALTDGAAGVDSGSITLTRTADQATKTATFSAGTLTSGSLTNGTFRAISPGAWTDTDAGSWKVTEVDVSDGYGNVTDDTSVAGSPTVTVTATPDTSAPVVAASPAANLTPASVDATTGAAGSTLNVRITDDHSGFASGQGTLSDGAPTEAIPLAITADDRVSGTSLDGTYAIPVSVPARQAAGTYHFTDLTLTDRYGNSAEGAVLTTLPSLTVTDTADTAGPGLSSLNVGPATINIDSSGAQLTVVAHATDAVSGIAEIDVTVTDHGGFADVVSLDGTDLVSGSPANGTYAIATGATGLALGVATISSVDLTDVAGKTTHLTTAQLSGVATRTTFNVVDQSGETTAPTVSSVTLAPTSVSTASVPGKVTVTASAADGGGGVAASGVATVSVSLAPPAGGGSGLNVVLGPGALVSGDPTSGQYVGRITIPRYAANGSWSVSDVNVVDAAGNSRDYSGAGLSTAGAATSVTVSGPVDHTAPTLASLTGATAVDATAATASATLTAGFTDDASGVCHVTVTATSPSGDGIRSASWAAPGGVCLTSGSAPVSLTFSRFSESGPWPLSVKLVDGQGNTRTLAASDLSGAGLPSALTVSAATDSTPPVLATEGFDPSGVDNSATDTPVVFEAHLTDSGNTASGLASASMTVTEPDGVTTQEVGLQLVAGTAANGWWQGGLVVPEFSQSGDWTITTLQATDVSGNLLSDDNGDLTTAGLPTGFDVTGVTDNTAPEVSGIQISPSSVDITNADGQSTVTLHLTDDSSGVSGAQFTLDGPNGESLPEATGQTPDTGTALDGQWSVPVDLAQYSSTGSWHIDNLVVDDVAGNSVLLQTADLDTASLPDTLTVTGTADADPPALTGLSVAPNPANTSSAAAVVTVTAHITDDASGFGGGTVTVKGPSGPTVLGTFSATPSSGSDLDGHYAATVQLPRFSAAGAWHVVDADLFDNVGHELDKSTVSQLDTLGGAFTVSDTAQDVTAPVLTGLSFSRANIDAALGQTDEVVRLALTDDHSGVAGGSITLTSPTGLISTYQLQGVNPGGSAVKGEYDIVVPFDSSSELGTWTVSEVDLQDNAGNSAALTGNTLGSHNTFQMSTHAHKSAAPLGVTVTPGAGVATVTWQPPADDGGAPISSYAVSVSPKGNSHVTVAGSSAVVTGLTSGVTYTVTVSAVNLAGTGTASKAISLAGSNLKPKSTKVSVKVGKRATLSVTLTDAKSRKAISKAKVYLLAKPAGSTAFSIAKTATTSSKGAASAAVKPSVDTAYEWTYSGVTNSRAGSTSAGTAVTVLPAVHAAASPARVAHGHATSIYGTLTPADLGAHVTLQRQSGRTWKALPGKATVANQKLPNGKTAVGFVLHYTPSAKGTEHLRVVVAASKSAGSGRSPTFTLSVT